MSERICLLGAGGHAKVVLDAARRQGLEVVAVFDDDPARQGTTLLGCPVVGGREALPAWGAEHGVGHVLVAVGGNVRRAELGEWLRRQGLELATVVHPRATLGEGVRLGPGSVVLAGAVLNVEAELGAHVIVNTGATVDHDCRIGDAVHIAPGCHLCGDVSVGAGSLLGAGCTVIPGIRIGRAAVVGAGAVVVRDVADGATVLGVPARVAG